MNSLKKNSNNKKAWERMKGEPNKAFNLFKYFLMMGKDRTLNGLHKKLSDDPSTEIKRIPTLSTLKVYSSKYNWIERVGVYDDYIDSQRLKRMEQRNIDKENEYYSMREPEMINILKELQNNISSVFEELQNDTWNTKPTSKAHALKSVAQSIDIYIKNIRLLYNLSTDTQSTNISADVKSKNITRRVPSMVDDVSFDEFETSDEFFDKQLEFIDHMIQEHNNKPQ